MRSSNRRHLGIGALLALLAAPMTASAQDIPGARRLEDGTYVVSPLRMAAEMIRDDLVAKRRYAGKPIQFEGKIADKLATPNYVQLSIIVQVQQYMGYRRFWCISLNRSSMKAAEALDVGDTATLAGIYQPGPMAGLKLSKRELDDILGYARGRGDTQATLRFDSCVVLTGNAQGEISRAAMAAEAAGDKDEPKR